MKALPFYEKAGADCSENYRRRQV
ncbi:hypothetical protein CL3_13590 [butyrate-producing bacterium SM4/1]|nr:hypothetical protein CL3_13590 [butyrate-producing bacterium SM4/1]